MSFRPMSAAGALLCLIVLIPAGAPFAADEWLPITPEELQMTREPKAPGAPAIYLYRQVDRDDQKNQETDYVRIKVLTEEGRKQGDVEILYSSKYDSIHNIKARSIRPDGAITKFEGKIYDKTVVKSHDLKYAAKTFAFPGVQVGSILEYRYTVDEDPNYVFFSHWDLNSDLFTRHAKFSVKLNDSLTARWVGYRIPPGVTLPKNAPDKIVRLEVSDVPALEEEEYAPPDSTLHAIVDFIYTDNPEVALDKFWKAEDKKMNGAVDSFVGKHKEMAQAAAGITPASDASDIRLRKLYEKVQSLRNTSFEPEKTEQEMKREKGKQADNIMEVWKRGAGNGLQLTWLYLGLVRGAGFQAYPVALAHRDSYLFIPELMNSSVLSDYVVLVKDGGVDKYFDPGTEFTPFGMLPWSETRVIGMRVDKDGGAWVETPLSSSSDSRVLRKAALQLDTEGTLSGKLTLTFTGLAALGQRLGEVTEDAAQRKTDLEQFAQSLIPSGCEVQLTNTPDWTSSSPELVTQFNVKIPGWASAAGRKALVPVGVFSNGEKHMFEHASRSAPIYFHYPYQTADDVTIELPFGWRAGTLPARQKRDLKLLVYDSGVEAKAGTIHMTRVLQVNGISVVVSNYPVVRAFFQYVRNSDEQQIIVLPVAGGGN